VWSSLIVTAPLQLPPSVRRAQMAKAIPRQTIAKPQAATGRFMCTRTVLIQGTSTRSAKKAIKPTEWKGGPPLEYMSYTTYRVRHILTSYGQKAQSVPRVFAAI